MLGFGIGSKAALDDVSIIDAPAYHVSVHNPYFQADWEFRNRKNMSSGR